MSPGGAGPLPLDEWGSGASDVAGAVGSLAVVPVVMVGSLVGLLVIWWACKWVAKVISR